MENNSGVMTRRQFLQLSTIAGAAMVTGCAVNPVTGENQLMMVSRETEISMDKQQSPYQFSSDYGVLQNRSINAYIAGVGNKLASKTHRLDMPYSFRCVNATYVNAYAFPGGSIAVTRGILLKLSNEAELAALLGHELGHVNARHSAEQMSKASLSSLLIGGVSAVIGAKNSQLGELTQKIGMVGQGALLARYSRDNEREADALGNEYMVVSGYSTNGFVGLMALLNRMNEGHNDASQILFSTHPMSSERYETAIAMAGGKYASTRTSPLYRERYMDTIAPLRAQEKLVTALQEGDAFMGQKKYDHARASYQRAVKIDSRDYTARVMLGRCLLVQKNYRDAYTHARRGHEIYPTEGQACQVAGFAALQLKKYNNALKYFNTYDRLLPGNPTVLFFKGYSLDGMSQVEPAARQYAAYLGKVRQGEYAAHAYKRLKSWGYIKN
ncbi:Tat (twin-arginine translocation) pathway signal sequence [Desulfocicer vacuolatum DSM 3385]|uniref:Tat (Twin-arginine translocation) pathway signal sequence n=1 Tax=Desulfocicer vacuolatum DSM 3385 TaxID=1121400 RepID=A0A1W2BA68_9BACT|nr:M48 family metalloprotease [Desulfocicer vacuolatum]SMC69268.1 Tat (twin-arginine translocation) pathway signal sequence [Desulfocicer vacuolatum DSM 3385]